MQKRQKVLNQTGAQAGAQTGAEAGAMSEPLCRGVLQFVDGLVEPIDRRIQPGRLAAPNHRGS
ncbi:MAG TPA: hypothetical protein VFR19_21215 [Hyphomicrobiaceae bacterium]|nr:hypothetical protein [Hyphomicrobiaceae bacterium]